MPWYPIQAEPVWKLEGWFLKLGPSSNQKWLAGKYPNYIEVSKGKSAIKGGYSIAMSNNWSVFKMVRRINKNDRICFRAPCWSPAQISPTVGCWYSHILWHIGLYNFPVDQLIISEISIWFCYCKPEIHWVINIVQVYFQTNPQLPRMLNSCATIKHRLWIISILVHTVSENAEFNLFDTSGWSVVIHQPEGSKVIIPS